MPEKALFREFGKILGPENFFGSKADKIACSASPRFDGSQPEEYLPLAAARPRHMGQLRELVTFCRREGIPLALGGAGTALRPKNFKGSPLLILFTGLNRILDMDYENRLALVEAGVACGRLAAAAEEHNLFYPPDPGMMDLSTIGGNLAMNAAGPSSLKYGASRDYLLRLRAMTTEGEILDCAAMNGIPGRPAPAFPLADLFCGSEGALAIICGAVIKLLPRPAARHYFSASFPANAQACAAAAAIMASSATPAKMEFMDAICAHCINAEWNSPMLLLELDGHPVQVEEEARQCAGILRQFGVLAIGGGDSPANVPRMFGARGGLLPRLAAEKGPFRLESACCPPSRLPSLLEGLEAISEQCHVEMAIFAHAGAARAHVALFAGGGAQALAAAAKEIFTLELVLNNAISSEAEAELERGEWQSSQEGATRLSRELRRVFDPAGLLADQPLPGAEEDARRERNGKE